MDHDSAVLILVENDGGFLLVVFCISWSDFEREIEKLRLRKNCLLIVLEDTC